VSDKLLVAQALDDLGVDYIEGGWPGANVTDTTFFEKDLNLGQSKFTAFGMTKRVGRSVENDPAIAALINTKAQAICLVGKAWDYHVDVALKVSHKENLSAIEESLKFIGKNNREALFDAEHFFDGYKSNRNYALDCIKAAHNSGASWIILCDTNGGTLPHEIESIVHEVVNKVKGINIGIHAHNDTENAVANTLAAIRSGARHIQGTINGLGERCGNANLSSVLPTLVLKGEFSKKFETAINEEKLKYLTKVSKLLDEIVNRVPNRHAPYVGASAFAHKGGLHVSAVQKDPKTYEHVDPAKVGNERHIIISEQSGRSNILARLNAAGIKIDTKDEKVQKLLDAVKEREFIGYSYDGADASFELLARKIIGKVPKYFEVKNYKVTVEQEKNSKKVFSEAKAEILVGNSIVHCIGKGVGPVNALDNAVRSDLGKYSEYIKDLKLIDYKVRILNTGTEAKTRVSIESIDASGVSWFTIGVSNNIVEASMNALVDSIMYKLLKDNAPI